jgi:DNA-binding transcriptional ArsR family regulator
LRALSHPLRLRILALVAGQGMSSAELARELDMNHAAVSFHVRQLVAAGYLELAETRSVRGGQERRYRERVVSGSEWVPEDHRLMVSAMAEELTRRVADGSGTWKIFADAELWIDREIWDEARARIAAVMKDLGAAAAAPHTGGTVHVSATALMFEIGDGEPRTTPSADGVEPPTTRTTRPRRPG